MPFRRKVIIILIILLAVFGLWQVLSAGVERWRNHSSNCCSKEPRPDQQDGCMGIQRLCFRGWPHTIRGYSYSYVLLSWVNANVLLNSLSLWIHLSELFFACPCVKRFVMSPSGVRGWGSLWRRCMEHKSLLKPGRAGLMGLHSLQKDQKVLNTYTNGAI